MNKFSRKPVFFLFQNRVLFVVFMVASSAKSTADHRSRANRSSTNATHCRTTGGTNRAAAHSRAEIPVRYSLLLPPINNIITLSFIMSSDRDREKAGKQEAGGVSAR